MAVASRIEVFNASIGENIELGRAGVGEDRMREVLTTVRQTFDFVIIDTPPVLPVADAVILGTRADAVVVCARAGVLVREDAKFCRERLRYADVPDGLRGLGITFIVTGLMSMGFAAFGAL